MKRKSGLFMLAPQGCGHVGSQGELRSELSALMPVGRLLDEAPRIRTPNLEQIPHSLAVGSAFHRGLRDWQSPTHKCPL